MVRYPVCKRREVCRQEVWGSGHVLGSLHTSIWSTSTPCSGTTQTRNPMERHSTGCSSMVLQPCAQCILSSVYSALYSRTLPHPSACGAKWSVHGRATQGIRQLQQQRSLQSPLPVDRYDSYIRQLQSRRKPGRVHGARRHVTGGRTDGQQTRRRAKIAQSCLPPPQRPRSLQNQCSPSARHSLWPCRR